MKQPNIVVLIPVCVAGGMSIATATDDPDAYRNTRGAGAQGNCVKGPGICNAGTYPGATVARITNG